MVAPIYQPRPTWGAVCLLSARGFFSSQFEFTFKLSDLVKTIFNQDSDIMAHEWYRLHDSLVTRFTCNGSTVCTTSVLEYVNKVVYKIK